MMNLSIKSILLEILLMVIKTKCTVLIETAVVIARNAFDFTDVTMILWKHDDPVGITDILMEYPGIVATVAIENHTALVTKQLYKTRIRQTIFVASTPEDFEFMAKVIKEDVIVPLLAILILTQPIRDVNEVTKATQAAWENDIGDIVVITTNKEENKMENYLPYAREFENFTTFTDSSNEIISIDTLFEETDYKGNWTDKNTLNEEQIELWTYFPYGNGECGNFTAMPLVITQETTFYPNKFRNFYGCPVRVTLLHFVPYLLFDKDENGTVKSIAGIDGKSFNLVMEKLNASIDVVCSVDHGGIGSIVNGTGTGSFGDLVNNTADIFSPAILLTYIRYQKSQLSYVYETLDVYFCGPNRRPVHEWAKAVLPFFTNITPFIVLTFVVFITVTKVIRRYDLCKPNRKRGVFFMSFVMFLGQEVKFETNSWLVNGLFVLWIWFCMIVRIGYQGDLVDGLQKTLLEPPLGTFDEAVAQLDGYGGVEIFRQFYKNTHRESQFTAVRLDEIRIYIEDIAKGKRFLLITDIMLVRWFKQTLQVLDAPLTRAHVCMYMRPRWPAALEVDRIIFDIAEMGFIQKIIDDNHYEWLIHSDQGGDTREAQPLDMTTLGACFYGLLVTCAVCFVIFCGELICHKYEIKNKLKRKFKVK